MDLIKYLFYAFFWVISWRPKFIFQRFGTLCLFHLHRQVGASTRTRNVGIQNSDAGESPKRK